jgi:hypothetical protein
MKLKASWATTADVNQHKGVTAQARSGFRELRRMVSKAVLFRAALRASIPDAKPHLGAIVSTQQSCILHFVTALRVTPRRGVVIGPDRF